MTFRAATSADLERIAYIHNSVWLEYPVTAANLMRVDAFFAARRRFVLEVAGVVVAHALIDPSADGSGANLELDVLPDVQGRGFGGAFSAWLEGSLSQFSKVLVSVPEAHGWAFRFVLARGFREVRRSWHQVLESRNFDAAGFVNLERDVAAHGYCIRPYLEIADEAKLYALYSLTSRDVPGATKLPSFEEYRERVLESVLCRLEAYFVAVKNGAWVGFTGTRQRAEDRMLEWHTGMTGVLREHRGHGLGVALKCAVIRLAQVRGILKLHTNNDSLNAPMLEVNRWLGYRRVAGSIYFERVS
jgi:GNAT superfamily N-acetyltransferase